MKKMGIRVPGIGHRIKSKVRSTRTPSGLILSFKRLCWEIERPVFFSQQQLHTCN